MSNSSFAFKGKNEDIRSIGARLGARTIVEGSVRKSGNRLRITAQLSEVTGGYQLWSERHDRDWADVFAIQEEIAGNIVRALGKVRTRDVHAYDFYLRGRELFHEGTRKSIRHASEMFTNAIAGDQNYALAYSGLADCHSYLFMYFDKEQENIERAVTASKKAIVLDPDLAEAHAARGLGLSLSAQYDEAEVEFDKSITLNPNLYEAYYFYGRTCRQQGKMEQAASMFEKASEVRPEDYQAVVFLASACRKLGRSTEAEAAAHRAVALVEKQLRLNPDDARALCLGGGVLMTLGKTEDAISWANRAQSINNDPDLDTIRDQPRFQKACEKLR